MSDSQDADEQRFLDLSTHKLAEQYRSYTHLRTRAHHLFAASTIVSGVVVSALINAETNLGCVPTVLLLSAPAAFVLTQVMCMLSIGAGGWEAGPPLQDIDREYLQPLREHNVSVPVWLAEQVDKSYRLNLPTQRRNGIYLNIAAGSMVVQLLAMGASAYFLGAAN